MMNIYNRIIIIVSCILFSLLALLATIMIDLNDRDFPQAINSKSRINLHLNPSDGSINKLFSKIVELDMALDLGLVKVSPDFDSDGDREVFVSLNDHKLPHEFTWFRGDDTAKIMEKSRLTNSLPDGTYIVTRTTSRLDEFSSHLKSFGVEVVRRDASVLDSLLFIVMEKGFATAVLASLALIASLALFWLSIKARSRALRVLGGTSTLRIQIQDIAIFCKALLCSAGIITIISTSYIGIFHGLMYINIFLKVFISLQIGVIVLSAVIALVMSASAWPSTTMFATRQPLVKKLRPVAIIIQALTFVLVISTVGPALTTYQQSSDIAAEMSQWKKLADQVAIVYVTDIDGMDRTETAMGALIKDAELNDMTALSYTYTKKMRPSIDFHNYSAISFVNEHWLDLLTVETEAAVVAPILKHDIPDNLLHEIREELDVLNRKGDSEHIFEQLQFRQTVNQSKRPVMLGGGDGSLYFGNDILFVVVPSIYDTYNASNLTSLISTSNIIFTGATATEQLIKQHQLDVQSLRNQGILGELHVVYIAEEGILRAQFTAYVAWLKVLSLITLIIAFTIATAMRTFITATLQAKHDFPLRLAGKSWMRILQGRLAKELFAGVMLTCIVILLQKNSPTGIILLTAGYGMFIVPISHFLAENWCFNGVSRRRF